MALFKYRALDANGQPAEGVMEEDSARRVIAALEQRGLSVNLVAHCEPKRFLFARKPKLSWDDLHQFNEHLHTVTRSGGALVPAMAVMEQDIGRPQIKKVLQDVRQHMEAGNTLSDAFARHPRSFSPVYTSLVRAGEQAGSLPSVFSCLATYSKRMIELRSSIQETLAYPLMVLLVAAVIVGYLLTYVVPIFADIFAGFGGNLPAPTQLLVDASAFFNGNFWSVTGTGVLGVVLAVWIIMSLLQARSGGLIVDRLKSLIPGYGRVYITVSIERFSRALGLLLRSGVRLPEALDLAGHAAGNAVIHRAAGDAARHVSGGAGLADALKKTGRFANSFCWLLGNAESRGETDSALLLLADDLVENSAQLQRQLKFIIGPLMVIGLGMTIGFIVLSLYLPIFSLGDIINK